MQSDSSKWKNESLKPECDRAQLLITRHIDGEADADDAQALRKHIDACPRCRQALEIQTRQSHKVAMALQTLWPAEITTRKTSASLERFRHAVMRAAWLMLILLLLTFVAQRTYAPTPARQDPPAASATPTPEAENKPKVAEVEPKP